MKAIDLINLSRSYWESKVLFVAANLKVFTLLDQEKKKANEVAASLNLNHLAIVRFLEALVSLKLLKKESGYYKNTKTSSLYLVEGKDTYLGHAFHHSENLWEYWEALGNSVKHGKPVAFKLTKKTSYPHRLKDYLYAMDDLSSILAQEVGSYLKISNYKEMLDLGGGVGSYALSFAKMNPDLKVTIFELRDTLKHAKKFIQRAKLKSQVKVIAGNCIEESLGKDQYDLIFISNLVHIYDFPSNQKIIDKAYQALIKDGKIAIHGFALNNHQTTPKEATLFDLNMLIGTISGQVYPQDEIKRWLKEVGFKQTRSYGTALKTKVITAIK
ncbi:MAG: methyltransferase [bacterium]